MSSRIRDVSHYDQTIHVRLSGINDLIAAEGKYHPNCLKRFERNMFDRYFQISIKCGTRKWRQKNTVAIRRPVSSRDVPLPAKWENFIAHEGNKEDLARFLSQQLLILQAPADKVIVAAGGWSNPERVESSDPRVDVESLEGCHEEADTRTILHCVRTMAISIVV